MPFDMYRDAPLGYLARVALDPAEDAYTRGRAKQAVIDRLPELARAGWAVLGYDGRRDVKTLLAGA